MSASSLSIVITGVSTTTTDGSVIGPNGVPPPTGLAVTDAIFVNPALTPDDTHVYWNDSNGSKSVVAPPAYNVAVTPGALSHVDVNASFTSTVFNASVVLVFVTVIVNVASPPTATVCVSSVLSASSLSIVITGVSTTTCDTSSSVTGGVNAGFVVGMAVTDTSLSGVISDPSDAAVLSVNGLFTATVAPVHRYEKLSPPSNTPSVSPVTICAFVIPPMVPVVPERILFTSAGLGAHAVASSSFNVMVVNDTAFTGLLTVIINPAFAPAATV